MGRVRSNKYIKKKKNHLIYKKDLFMPQICFYTVFIDTKVFKLFQTLMQAQGALELFGITFSIVINSMTIEFCYHLSVPLFVICASWMMQNVHFTVHFFPCKMI